MPHVTSVLNPVGRNVLPCVMVSLLVLAAVASDSPLVSTLRGRPTDNDERQPPPLGYYEALIHQHFQRLGAGRSDCSPQPPPDWLPFSDERAGIVQESQTYLHWKLRPDLDNRWNGTSFHTNRLGYRSPEIDLEKSDGTYRVLVFGSSNTMGYGVNDDEIYTRHLERWLSERVGPNYQVEVVNLAVAGDSPTRRLVRLQQEAERLRPDWLICDASGLDGFLEDGHIHAVVQNRIPIPFPFVRQAVARSGVDVTDSLDAFRKKFAGESVAMFDDVYAGLSQEAKRLNTPLTVLILPRTDSKETLARDFEQIRSLARKHRLDYLDLSGIFDHLAVDEFRISAWDKHPNPQGHRLIFQAIRDSLLRRGELPGLPLAPPSTLQADRSTPRSRDSLDD